MGTVTFIGIMVGIFSALTIAVLNARDIKEIHKELDKKIEFKHEQQTTEVSR